MIKSMKSYFAGALVAAGISAGISDDAAAQDKTVLLSQSFQDCVEEQVKAVFPHAQGGLVLAEDRLPLYQVYGDMLHYRERGLSEVNSVSINLSQKILPTDLVIDVYVHTRKDEGIVVSEDVLGMYSETERDYMTNSRDFDTKVFDAAIRGSDEYNEVEPKHIDVIVGVLGCHYIPDMFSNPSPN